MFFAGFLVLQAQQQVRHGRTQIDEIADEPTWLSEGKRVAQFLNGDGLIAQRVVHQRLESQYVDARPAVV